MGVGLCYLAWKLGEIDWLAAPATPRTNRPSLSHHTSPHLTLCAEVEREKECVCIVSHQAVLRALYGYFMNQPLDVSVPTEEEGVAVATR